MADSAQTSLFDLFDPGHSGAAAKSRPVKWSYSRRGNFETCLLKYYYQYYGSSARSAPNEPLKEQLKLLKGLKSIPLRMGEIVHFVIERHFKRLRENPGITNTGIDSWARDMFRKDLEASVEYQRTGQPSTSQYAVLLSDFVLRDDAALERWNIANESLGTAVTNFLLSRQFETFRYGGLHPDAILEEKLSIKLGESSASGKIDLAFPTEDGISIVDWKTGTSTSADDSLQLLSYALLVSNKLGIEPERIRIFKAYLELDSVTEDRASVQEILRAKVRIIQDIGRMEAMDRYGATGISGAFTPSEHVKICRICPFRTVCPEFQRSN